MKNPNTTRSLKQTFYNMTRRYGEPAYIYKVEEADTDYKTGAVTREVDRIFVRNCVKVPSSMTRQVIYTASMMQTARPFAWQGSGQDVEMTMFMIFRNDLRNLPDDWCEIEPSQWISIDDDTFQIDKVGEFDGGWLLGCKQAEGSGPGHWEDNFDWDDCENWTD